MLKPFLEVGEIVATHGVNGEMRINPWSDDPTFLTQFTTFYLDDKGERSLSAKKVRAHGNVVLLEADGVESVDDVIVLIHKIVYVKRDDVPLEEGTILIQDLIGCTVYDADDADKVYGKITDVMQTGANDVWEITNDKGDANLIPALSHVVLSMDIENRRTVIRPLKGIFDV